MPPPKKAAKKSARQIAGHSRDKHHHANDLRRAYEHMGRLTVLRKLLKSSAADAVDQLTALAEQAAKDGHNKDAASFLRASEHVSFAALAGVSVQGRLSAGLEHSIKEQFEELMLRAREHWEDDELHSGVLVSLYQSFGNSAAAAFQARHYHQALEYARAAEALAHGKQHAPRRLAKDRQILQLQTT